MEPVPVTLLISQLRSDDPAIRDVAAQRIWDHYFPPLLAIARNQLDRRVRQREDEEDVLQSMYRSFCQRHQRGDYDLKNRDQLWALLLMITKRKTLNVAARHHATKRDVARETSPLADGSESDGLILEQMDASCPSPADAAALNEMLEMGLKKLIDPELRQIALDKLAGWTNREIAGRMGYIETTIERKVKLIRARWSKEL